MIVNEIIIVLTTIFSVLVAFNLWLVIGFSSILLFGDFTKEIKYTELFIVSLTFPLALLLMLAKFINHKEHR